MTSYDTETNKIMTLGRNSSRTFRFW